MASRMAGIRDSLVAHLVAGKPYSIDPVSIFASWFPYLEREELGARTEIVVAMADTFSESSTRSTTKFARTEESLELGVLARRAIDWTRIAEGDRMATFAEELWDQVATHQPGTIEGHAVYLRGVRFDPFLVPEYLTEYRVFETRILASYLVDL